MLIEFQTQICATCMDPISVDGTYKIAYERLDGGIYLASVMLDDQEVTLNMAQNFAVLHHIYQHEQAMKDRAASLDPRLP